MKSGTTTGAAGCSLAATGLPGTAGTACRAGTTAGRVGAGLGVGGGGGGGVAEEEGTGSLLGKSGWAGGGGGGRVLGGGGGGRLVVGGGGGLLVVGGGGGLLDGGGGGGLLVVGGGGGLLVVGGGGGGLLLTGAGAGLLLVTGAGLLLTGVGLLLTVEGKEGLLAGFCSTSPTMALAGVPMEDPSLMAGRPLFLRSRNLSSSSVGGAVCGPLKAGAFIGPLNV